MPAVKKRRRAVQSPRLVGDKPPTDYSIWTLAYCQADMPYDFFGGSGLMSNQGTIQIPMLYTVLVGGAQGQGKHVVLVDAGFGNQDWLSRYQFFGWEDPSTVLAKIGLTPADVDTILVTHLHFDHIGNFSAFPTPICIFNWTNTWAGCVPCHCRKTLGAVSEAGFCPRLTRRTFIMWR